MKRTEFQSGGVLAAALLTLGALGAAADTTQSSERPDHSAHVAAEQPVERAALPRTLEPEAAEKHFGTLTQITDGGENAEAYFSFDGKQLSFQSTFGFDCDQIFTIGVDGTNLQLVSTGKGRTTCAYFMPDNQHVVYSSTHHHDAACPPPPDMSRGYVWGLYPTFDVFVARQDGTDLRQLTDEWGYDAEATISPRGDKIVFTSVRDGDLDIYTMNLDGTDVTRLTHDVGYDGGPFYSPDGSKIVYRAHYPQTEEAIADYQGLLAQHMIRPGQLEVYVMDADGKNKVQVTDLQSATFAPFFHPSGTKIIFSSNHPDRGREFDLWMVNTDGTGLEQVTHSGGFDGFPMFAPDGKTFVFASNRHNTLPNETNIFVTTWKD